MITKAVISDKIVNKRRKWAIFEDLHETNDSLDDAIIILSDLRPLLKQLPDTLIISVGKADRMLESVCVLDSALNNCIETAGMLFDEIEMKLDELQKSLLHDEAGKMHNFSKLASEVQSSQTLIDALVSNAEIKIYKFLASENLFVNRQTIDNRIMEMVLSYSC